MEASNVNGTRRDPTMSIQRVRKDASGFAQINNEALRDKRLSFKARGVLAMVLSHSEDWEAPLEWFLNQSDKDGRHAIQSALNELTELGYRKVSREQTPDGLFHTVVDWDHYPIIRPTDNPTVGFSDRRKTRASIRTQSSRTQSPEHQKRNTTAADAAFTEFWQTYPRRTAKGAAVKAFRQALKKASADTIIAGAARYRDDPNRADAYTAHAATWLNAERWDDDPLPEPATAMTAAQLRAKANKRALEQWANEERTP